MMGDFKLGVMLCQIRLILRISTLRSQTCLVVELVETLALSFFCSQAESTPTCLLGQTVGQQLLHYGKSWSRIALKRGKK